MKKNPARNVHLVKGPTNLLEKINLSIDVDSRLYKEDIEASIAHVKMLSKTKTNYKHIYHRRAQIRLRKRQDTIHNIHAVII